MRREYGPSLWWRLVICWIRCNRRRSHRAACRDSVVETDTYLKPVLVAGAEYKEAEELGEERGWDNHQNRW